MAAKVVLLLLLVLGAAAAERVRTPLPIPTVTVDLDAPAEKRWNTILTALVQTHGWDYSLKPALDYVEKLLPPSILKLAENLSSAIIPDLPEEMIDELRGIEQAVTDLGHAGDAPLPMLVLLNILYEMSTACTSIVAMDAQNRIWHSRNLDWGFSNYSLENLTVVANFQQGGKTVYQGVTWGGYVGLLTGMRVGRFSISIDQRTTPDVFAILQALRRIHDHKAVPVSFLLRQTLASDIEYSSAVLKLANTEVTSSVYLIIGGANALEGAVITRDEKPVARDVWSMPHGPQPWYVIETNYDHDTQPPQHDDRRDLAIHALNALGQARVSEQTLFTVMTTPAANNSRGVLNDDTQYTAIMSGSTGVFDAWTWR